MNLTEKEITRWELAGVDVANLCRADRDGSIQCWWTPVEEFNAYVLNVFAPIDHVLWDFSEYEAFGSGKFEYMHRVRLSDSTTGKLEALIRDTGAELKSDVAGELLRGLTQYFGDRYHSPHRGSAWSFSMRRHLSVAVPESCRPAVSRYFREQLRVFGESSTRSCPEDVSLTYDSTESDPTLGKLLCSNVLMLSEQERNAQLALIRSGVDLLAQGKPEHFAFTGNAVGISTAGIEHNAAALGDFAEIARFRVETAVRHYALRGVEKLLKYDLANKDWGLLCLADLRDELRGRLLTKLAAYPVIENNPFERAER